MGDIETKFRKRKSRKDIKRAILTSVKAVGFLSMAVVAPNAIQCMRSFGIVPGKREKEIMERSRDRLIESKLLKYEDGFIKLTEKGQMQLDLLERKNWTMDKPRKWDGRWRMLIFDIPENRKYLRDKIRTTLVSIGFVRLQDSAWVYPYDCEDLVTLLKADFKIGKDLLYVIIDFIENDKNLRKSFGLPLN